MRMPQVMPWLVVILTLGLGDPGAADEVRTPRPASGPSQVRLLPPVDRASAGEPGEPAVRQTAAEESRPPTDDVPMPPHSEGIAPLTLNDLEQTAWECNPTLVQARMAVRAAQGAYVQAGLYPNPVLGYVADEIGNLGSQGFQGGGVAQEIVTAGKLPLGRAVAGHEIEQARFAWEAQRWRVTNDVRVGYYETLLAQKTIDVNEQLLGVEKQVLKSTEQLRAAQEVSEVDVLQARVETENAQLDLSESRYRYQSAWRRLAAVVGRPQMEPAPLAGDVTRDLPAITWEQSLALLLTQSPELAQARAGVERARCEVARQCALRNPQLRDWHGGEAGHRNRFHGGRRGVGRAASRLQPQPGQHPPGAGGPDLRSERGSASRTAVARPSRRPRSNSTSTPVAARRPTPQRSSPTPKSHST